jgi:hypothetical protein
MLGKALRYKVAGAVAVLAVAGLAGTAAIAAAAVPATKTPTPLTFTGAITCSVTGKMTASPGLTMGSQKTTLTISAVLEGCKGNTTEKKVTIEKGVLTASTTLTASCTTFETGKGVAPSGTIHWTGSKGSVAPTKIAFTSASSSVDTGNQAITVSLPGTGKSIATGSFAGGSSKATVVFDQTWGSLASQCFFPIGGGVTGVTFSGQLGPSAASVG